LFPLLLTQPNNVLRTSCSSLNLHALRQPEAGGYTETEFVAVPTPQIHCVRVLGLVNVSAVNARLRGLDALGMGRADGPENVCPSGVFLDGRERTRTARARYSGGIE
jgi:hypothetical protein